MATLSHSHASLSPVHNDNSDSPRPVASHTDSGTHLSLAPGERAGSRGRRRTDAPIPGRDTCTSTGSGNVPEAARMSKQAVLLRSSQRFLFLFKKIPVIHSLGCTGVSLGTQGLSSSAWTLGTALGLSHRGAQALLPIA